MWIETTRSIRLPLGEPKSSLAMHRLVVATTGMIQGFAARGVTDEHARGPRCPQLDGRAVLISSYRIGAICPVTRRDL